MTTAELGKRKRRKMKQMQGLLMLSRLEDAAVAAIKARHAPKPRRVNVVLQPQQLELAYSALEDQEMLHVLGRIDLRGAKLEQVPDGFIIYETGTAARKKVKLQDKDKATIDAWFFAAYTTISEYERLPILSTEDVGHKFSAVLTSSLRDEATDAVEFEISCQLVLPVRPVDKPSIKWKVWKSFAEIQAFDDELRISYGSLMKGIMFPRDRKRDSIFGGMRKKSLQELKEQQLALYVENVFQIPELSVDTALVDKVKRFLGFNSFFDIVPSPDEDIAPDPEQFTTAESNWPSNKVDVQSNEGVVLDHESENLQDDNSSEQPVDRSLTRDQNLSLLDAEGDEFIDVAPETDPKAAKKLHKKVIQTVRELVSYDEERVQDFQDQTKDFGRGKTSATEYCSFLLGAFGAHECLQLIPLMARLLPDDTKRNELVYARAAIWRRAHRRHRRRSKQFSESVVMQKQKTDLQKIENLNNRMRPKSDSLGALNWAAEREPLQISGRSSMIETSTSLPVDNGDKMRKSESEVSGPFFRPGLFDARRKLDKRPSFNMFGETMPSNPIDEENPAANESDEDERRGATGQHVAPSSSSSLDRKLSLSGSAWTRPAARNASFLDEDDDDDSSIGDGSMRSRGGSHSRPPSSVKSSGSFRRTKSRNGSSQLRRYNSRQSSSFIEDDNQEWLDEAVEQGETEESDQNDGELDSHSRFQKNRRRASKKFDVEKAASSPVEDNPVLARLKKQGAVNFMMR